MSVNVNLGGDRLGSGAKMNVNLHGFERSTHDLGNIWRSTMATGTLVPFMQQYALNGDTWEIKLNTLVRTLPTNAPIFGSFKMQMDIFTIPIRLYVASLKGNKLNVGNNMQNLYLPSIQIKAPSININKAANQPLEVQQVNQSSLMAYLGIRGLGSTDHGEAKIQRTFNALGHLAYLDIFKNYYANKQEEVAYVMDANQAPVQVTNIYYSDDFNNLTKWEFVNGAINDMTKATYILMIGSNNLATTGINNFSMEDLNSYQEDMHDIYRQIGVESGGRSIILFRENSDTGPDYSVITGIMYNGSDPTGDAIIKAFDLAEIDAQIDAAARHDNPLFIGNGNQPNVFEPLNTMISNYNGDANLDLKAKAPMQGLLLKTYQSDIFNNWVSTEWMDGINGISAVTAVDTSTGSFTMDTLLIAKKVYNMLVRIATAGGTYEDWQKAVWGENVFGQAQTPIYEGGASTEIIFNEVVNTSAGDNNAMLGDLGGKGTQSGSLKGGYVKIKVKEPSIIMGIVSITPRIDYSQGNEWFTNLKTMNDFHKPSLDGIGFQELITEQMAYWDTIVDNQNNLTKKSAGKQPAWINYQTNFNKTYGEFADPNKQMFMTLNRRYEAKKDQMNESGRLTIKDLTTYIDPMKFNYAFNYQNLDAQNFWVQIAMDVTARRKMSAKVIPNL